MNFYDSYTTLANRNTRVYSTGAHIQKLNIIVQI